MGCSFLVNGIFALTNAVIVFDLSFLAMMANMINTKKIKNNNGSALVMDVIRFFELS
jgi:hypothetical protein